MARKSILDNKEQLIKVVQNSTNLNQVLQAFGLSGYSDNYSTLRHFITKFNITTSHFTPELKRAEALRRNGIKRTIPLKEILSGNHPRYKTYLLSKRLIQEGIFEPVCDECGQTNKWNKKPLTLQLDHIDGNRHNHVLENLRMLCPNCHTQTENWGGRNKY